jgi:hypothetical protein
MADRKAYYAEYNLTRRKCYEPSEESRAKGRESYWRNRDKELNTKLLQRRLKGVLEHPISVPEAIIKEVLEEYFIGFEVKFRDRTVIFNKYTNHYLELDFYIPEYKIAFELQGPTHYKALYGQERLERSIRLDSYKKEFCLANGIFLIEIPFPNIGNANSSSFKRGLLTIVDGLLKKFFSRDRLLETSYSLKE